MPVRIGVLYCTVQYSLLYSYSNVPVRVCVVFTGIEAAYSCLNYDVLLQGVRDAESHYIRSGTRVLPGRERGVDSERRPALPARVSALLGNACI